MQAVLATLALAVILSSTEVEFAFEPRPSRGSDLFVARLNRVWQRLGLREAPLDERATPARVRAPRRCQNGESA